MSYCRSLLVLQSALCLPTGFNEGDSCWVSIHGGHNHESGGNFDFSPSNEYHPLCVYRLSGTTLNPSWDGPNST